MQVDKQIAIDSSVNGMRNLRTISNFFSGSKRSSTRTMTAALTTALSLRGEATQLAWKPIRWQRNVRQEWGRRQGQDIERWSSRESISPTRTFLGLRKQQDGRRYQDLGAQLAESRLTIEGLEKEGAFMEVERTRSDLLMQNHEDDPTNESEWFPRFASEEGPTLQSFKDSPCCEVIIFIKFQSHKISSKNRRSASLPKLILFTRHLHLMTIMLQKKNAWNFVKTNRKR